MLVEFFQHFRLFYRTQHTSGYIKQKSLYREQNIIDKEMTFRTIKVNHRDFTSLGNDIHLMVVIMDKSIAVSINRKCQQFFFDLKPLLFDKVIGRHFDKGIYFRFKSESVIIGTNILPDRVFFCRLVHSTGQFSPFINQLRILLKCIRIRVHPFDKVHQCCNQHVIPIHCNFINVSMLILNRASYSNAAFSQIMCKFQNVFHMLFIGSLRNLKYFLSPIFYGSKYNPVTVFSSACQKFQFRIIQTKSFRQFSSNTIFQRLHLFLPLLLPKMNSLVGNTILKRNKKPL